MDIGNKQESIQETEWQLEKEHGTDNGNEPGHTSRWEGDCFPEIELQQHQYGKKGEQELQEQEKRDLAFHPPEEPADICTSTGKQHPVCHDDADDKFIAVQYGEAFTDKENLCGKRRKPQGE